MSSVATIRETGNYVLANGMTFICLTLGIAVITLNSYGSSFWMFEFFSRRFAWTPGQTGPVYGTVVAIGDVTVGEGDGHVDVPITLSAPSNSVVEFDWATSNGAADSNNDYQSRSYHVAFLPGETTHIARVPVRDGNTAADAAAAPTQQVTANKAGDANTVDVEAKTKS